MNLSSRFTRTFTILVFFILILSFPIFYFAFERATFSSAVGRLKNLNAFVAKKITQNPDYNFVEKHHRQVRVVYLDRDVKNISAKVLEENAIWNTELQSKINRISVTSYPKINGKQFAITSVRYTTVIEDEYLAGVIMVVAWIFVFFTIMTIIIGELTSKKILKPFDHAMNEILNFNLKEGNVLNLMETSVNEFKTLNNFLKKMVKQSKKEYILLKEFTENTSHELQTPLASMKAKIELLMEGRVTEQQMLTLFSMDNEIDRLSSLNKSLILLANLEHFEKQELATTNLSEMIGERLFYFEDLFEMQGIEVTTKIEENVMVNVDKNLLLVVINNLINNANRHNIEKGNIKIILTSSELIIANTGDKPTSPTSELFERFKKGNPKQNSIGIGLALVKKILEIYNFQILYDFTDNYHIIKINLKPI